MMQSPSKQDIYFTKKDERTSFSDILDRNYDQSYSEQKVCIEFTFYCKKRPSVNSLSVVLYVVTALLCFWMTSLFPETGVGIETRKLNILQTLTESNYKVSFFFVLFCL